MFGSKRHHKYPGQQVSEYGFVLALVAVSLVVVLTVFGDSIVQGVESMVAGMNKPAPGKFTGVDSGNLNFDATQSSVSMISSVSSSGAPLYYTDSLAKSIETSGANGTTSEILTMLDQYIEQSLASGKLTPAQGDQLKALSKKGYDLANIEAVIEDMALNNPAALSQPYTYNGKTYATARELALQIGFDPDRKVYDRESQQFLNLYNDALKSGALSDPEVNKVVSTLSNQIINIANGVEGAAVQIQNGTERSSNYYQVVQNGLGERDRALGTNTQNGLDPKLIEKIGSDKVTEQKSDAICKADKKKCQS